MTFKQSFKKLSGFTLLELITTVVIVAVLAAIGFPAMQNLILDNRLSSAANSVVISINLARSEALTRRDTVSIVPAAGGWGDGWEVQDSTSATLRVFEAPGQGLTTSSNLSGGQVDFRANGYNNSGAFSVTICDTRGQGRRVSISVSGSTSIEKIASGCA